MGDQDRARRFIIIGAVVGAVISVATAIGMDTLYADSFQGTWRDAIAKDLNGFFSAGVSRGSFLVTIVFLLVLAFLAAFGAFMGMLSSLFLYRFFRFLGSR